MAGKQGTFRVTIEEQTFNQEVGVRLSDAIVKAKTNNTMLGRKLDLHGTTIGNLRTAKSRINGYHLTRICAALDVDVAEVLTGVKGRVRSKVAPQVELSTRVDLEFEICWDCGSKKAPTRCSVQNGERYYMCADCFARSTSVKVSPQQPELDKTAWNAMSKRERFKFEKECVAASLSALDPQATSDDAQRAVLIGLEAARLMGE